MLTEIQIRELERRGLANVKTMLMNANLGFGRGASISLSLTSEVKTPNLGEVLRGDIEDWVSKKETEQRNEEDKRFRIELGWIIATFIVSVVGTLAAVITLLK